MLSANHKPGYVRRLDVQRGQTVRSLTQISEACGISRKAVRYALSVLERDGFISKDEPFGAQQGHRITICKYNDYQLDPNDKGTVGAQQGTQEGTHAGTQEGNTNNNEKNEKNGKLKKDTPKSASPIQGEFALEVEEVANPYPGYSDAFVEFWKHYPKNPTRATPGTCGRNTTASILALT